MTTQFERHYDNIGEIIDARDVNELQDVININEQNVLLLKDVDFEDYALWLLENNEQVNRLWIDTFGDKTRIDSDASTGVVYIPKDRLIRIRNDRSEGYLYSETYTADKDINQVILLAHTVYPRSEDIINFQISINGFDWEDITKGELYIPTGIGNSFRLRANMGRASEGGPILYRWALLWGDDDNPIQVGAPTEPLST